MERSDHQKLLGRFSLERRLGSGGMSTVYLGRDDVLGRPVAVKLLRGDMYGEEEDTAARFRREGRTAASLSHANVVPVYDAGKDYTTDGEVSYIVMEYVSGGDLKELIDAHGPLPEGRLAWLGSKIASGLAHAHERGIIHRDIKPQNVLIDEYGSPKLTDFGIARALDGTVNVTRTGSYLGTALYSAPEQLNGERATQKSDVYSLGMTLYHAAAGSPPFSGSLIEVATQHMNREPDGLREHGAQMTAEIEGVILSCLAKNPDDRPTARELQKKLNRFGTSPFAPEAAAPRLGREMPRTKHQRGREAEAGRLAGRGTFRTGLSRSKIAGLALILLLLAALAALTAYTLLGSGNAADTGTTDNQNPVSQGSSEDRASDQEQNRASGDNEVGGGIGSGELTEANAVDAVGQTYLTIVVDRDYEASYAYLSEAYRNSEYPTQEDWAAQMGELRVLRFVEGPTVELGEGDATVRGEVQIIYTTEPDGDTPERLEQSTGVWTLVPEDGEWKIDDIRLEAQETQQL